MPETRARRVVLGALVLAGLLAASRDLTRGRVPVLGVLFGTLGAAVVLSMLSEVAPRLAASFAVLILAGAWTTAGPPVFDTLTNIVGGRNRT